MRTMRNVILLSLTLAIGAGSFALATSANANTVVRKCWVNRHGYQRCQIIRVRHNHRRRWCRRNGCYQPNYYNGPVIIGPIFRSPVIGFGWGTRVW